MFMTFKWVQRAVLSTMLLWGLTACASFSPSSGTGNSNTFSTTGYAPKSAPLPRPRPVYWGDYFPNIRQGAILVHVGQRKLHYWAPNGERREFPIAVPRTADLTRLGTTEIVRKRRNPDWRPTPSMLARKPRLPQYVGPGPRNPLGTRALYLAWQYYAIHGTNDPASIGTAASSGCFRLHRADIEWLFEQAHIGTPVRVL